MRRPTVPYQHVARLLLLLGLTGLLSAKGVKRPPSSRELADRFEHKLAHLRENAAAPRRDPAPTVFPEDEINAYFAERRLRMPEGVKSVHFTLGDGQVTAATTVDFQQLRRDRPDSNPLLAIFDGIHDCVVVAHATDSHDGEVRVTVESVTLDGMRIPKIALKMFIERFVNPKYPNVGLDKVYRLPAHIDSAVITAGQGTIIQK